MSREWTQHVYQKLIIHWEPEGRKKRGRPRRTWKERIYVHSHEGKRSKNGRMEQQKTMEYGSRKASSDVLNPRNILYIYIYVYIQI
jgi:hypothetical protein